MTSTRVIKLNTKNENKQKSSNEFKVLNLEHIREIGINVLRPESGHQTKMAVKNMKLFKRAARGFEFSKSQLILYQ